MMRACSSPALAARRLSSSSTPQSATAHRLIAPWLCIAVGSLLRLIWPLDFEWKFDEKWMWEHAHAIADGREPWPWVGMPSGVGLENPGASVWPFALLAYLTTDPSSMNFAVALLNVAALWGFALWVRHTWSERERTLGLWGVALFAVSPMPVLFARKIWAQDVLPVLLVPWLWAHRKRHDAAGAFAWGACGALLGQVHMSGFFAAASMTLATLGFDRKGTRWAPWFAGSALGAVPLMPWLAHVLGPAATSGSGRVWSLRFFWDAFMSTWGLSLRYSLHKHFGEFLRGPYVFGVKTWLTGFAHIALGLLAIGCAVVLLRRLRSLELSRELRIYACAVIAGGLLLHAMGVRVYPHYLIVWSPLLHILASWVLSHKPRWLHAACGLQLFITASFLWFIHVRGGAPRGDYGITYRAQSAEQRAP